MPREEHVLINAILKKIIEIRNEYVFDQFERSKKVEAQTRDNVKLPIETARNLKTDLNQLQSNVLNTLDLPNLSQTNDLRIQVRQALNQIDRELNRSFNALFDTDQNNIDIADDDTNLQGDKIQKGINKLVSSLQIKIPDIPKLKFDPAKNIEEDEPIITLHNNIIFLEKQLLYMAHNPQKYILFSHYFKAEANQIELLFKMIDDLKERMLKLLDTPKDKRNINDFAELSQFIQKYLRPDLGKAPVIDDETLKGMKQDKKDFDNDFKVAQTLWKQYAPNVMFNGSRFISLYKKGKFQEALSAAKTEWDRHYAPAKFDGKAFIAQFMNSAPPAQNNNNQSNNNNNQSNNNNNQAINTYLPPEDVYLKPEEAVNTFISTIQTYLSNPIEKPESSEQSNKSSTQSYTK
jgi:hypothetical protein